MRRWFLRKAGVSSLAAIRFVLAQQWLSQKNNQRQQVCLWEVWKTSVEKHFIGYYSLQCLRLITFTTIQKRCKYFFFLRKFWVSLFLITVFFSSLSVLRFLFFVWSGCNITGFGLTIKIAKLASQLLLVAAPLFDRYYKHHKISRIAFVHFSHPKFLIFNG